MIMLGKSIYIIDDINKFHYKIREVAYWHFIFVNNSATNTFEDYFTFKSGAKFKKELKFLITEKESYLIFEKYIAREDGEYLIKSHHLDDLIKELSFRICCNLICKMNKIDIIETIWDTNTENFSFKINPDFVLSDVLSPLDFLKNMYTLSCKHLKLKNHYKDLKNE